MVPDIHREERRPRSWRGESAKELRRDRHSREGDSYTTQKKKNKAARACPDEGNLKLASEGPERVQAVPGAGGQSGAARGATRAASRQARPWRQVAAVEAAGGSGQGLPPARTAAVGGGGGFNPWRRRWQRG